MNDANARASEKQTIPSLLKGIMNVIPVASLSLVTQKSETQMSTLPTTTSITHAV